MVYRRVLDTRSAGTRGGVGRHFNDIEGEVDEVVGVAVAVAAVAAVVVEAEVDFGA